MLAGQELFTEPAAERAGELDPVAIYLNEIGKYPLLDKADEARLGALVQDGLAAEAELKSLAGMEPKKAPKRRRSRLAVVGEDGELPEDFQESTVTLEGIVKAAAAAADSARIQELEQRALDGRSAQADFTQANLRLVVSIARKYQWSKLPLLDLIQEGNGGLMHAVEKFDHTKGFKFSTYATWWIRQAIDRGIANTARTIRLPVHIENEVYKHRTTYARLSEETGRHPTPSELAAEMGWEVSKVEDVAAIAYAYDHDSISADEPIGDETSTALGEMQADERAIDPLRSVEDYFLAVYVEEGLDCLSPEERAVLSLLHGFDGGDPRSSYAVANILGLPRRYVVQLSNQAEAKFKQFAEQKDLREYALS